MLNFYPRSPCGERLFLSVSSASAWQFLSTLSLRRATFLMERDGVQYYISIHALLAESDQLLVPLFRDVSHFYPRSPCGERPCSSTYRPLGSLISIHALLAESDPDRACAPGAAIGFLSTLSLRRATIDEIQLEFNSLISIHALLAESDVNSLCLLLLSVIFLSTLSLRRATAKVHKTVGHFCAYETTFMGIASSY